MMNFKEWLLNEASMGPQNIQYTDAGYPNFRIKIVQAGKELQLELLRGQGPNYKFGGDLGSDDFGTTNILKGYKLYNWHSDLPTGSGFGPLFYDIAMEIATKNGGYLASATFLNALKNYDPASREENKGFAGGDTSDAAEGLYKFYYYKRNDIEKVQPNIILGNEEGQSSKPYLYELYRKQPTVLNQLIQMNKNGKQPVLVDGLGRAIIDLNFNIQQQQVRPQQQQPNQFAGFSTNDKRTWQQRQQFLQSQGVDTTGWSRGQIMRGSNK